MAGKICYLGDTALTGAASYLAGVMGHFGLAFDYVPSDAAPPAAFAATPYALYVVSDYPAARFGAGLMEAMAARVAAGAGLVMLGGWDSYYGRLGEYHQSPLAAVLPVVMQSSDDRWNTAQPCLLKKKAEHPILEGLPWDQPPGVGGMNMIRAKPDAQTLLAAVPFTVRRVGDDFQFTAEDERSLLVVGRHGRGRTAALATDVAPHWVGGFVDWGDRRVTQPVGSDAIEVGNWYAQFFRNLVVWTGQL
jgi:hypothetical protein